MIDYSWFVLDIVHEVIEKDGPIPKKLKTSSASRGDHTPLYAFILRLLAEGRYNLVHWTGKAVGEFRIKDSSGLAKLWGEYRGNKVMNYDKMARALRSVCLRTTIHDFAAYQYKLTCV